MCALDAGLHPTALDKAIAKISPTRGCFDIIKPHNKINLNKKVHPSFQPSDSSLFQNLQMNAFRTWSMT
jgi:hypothetical protein